jgi:hypothetical protein
MMRRVKNENKKSDPRLKGEHSGSLLADAGQISLIETNFQIRKEKK